MRSIPSNSDPDPDPNYSSVLYMGLSVGLITIKSLELRREKKQQRETERAEVEDGRTEVQLP